MSFGDGMLRSWSTSDFRCPSNLALDSSDRDPQPILAIVPEILFMTMYVVPLCLNAQYTFGTGTEVFRDTKCMVLASASVVKREALMHIFGMKTIGPAEEAESQKTPRRMIV